MTRPVADAYGRPPRSLRFRVRTLLLILAGLATAGQPAWAAAAPSASDADEEVTAGAEADSPGTEDEDDATDVFVPTEEISEDFAVSFPVDI